MTPPSDPLLRMSKILSTIGPSGGRDAAHGPARPARRRLLALSGWLGVATVLPLAGCVSVQVGQKAPAHRLYQLHDLHADAPPLSAQPRVAGLLIQPLPADSVADTSAMAYSRRPHELAFYQFASWSERPVRQLPRLLQRRLDASGLVGAAGVIGDPLSADWLLTLSIEQFVHDVAQSPGTARCALMVELVDRRARRRVAQRHFDISAPVEQADAASAADGLSAAVSAVFDELLPWLDEALQQAVKLPGPSS